MIPSQILQTVVNARFPKNVQCFLCICQCLLNFQHVPWGSIFYVFKFNWVDLWSNVQRVPYNIYKCQTGKWISRNQKNHWPGQRTYWCCLSIWVKSNKIWKAFTFLHTGWDKEILNLLYGLFMHGISLCLQNHNLHFRKVMHRFILKIHTGFNAQTVAAHYDCRYFLVDPLITKISWI